MSQTMLYLLLEGTWQTLYMVFAAALIAMIVGLPLGIILYISRTNNIFKSPKLHHSLSIIINMTRSIPFIILMIAIIPFTRLIVGTSIGTSAAIVPLSLCAIPFVARLMENVLLEINPGLIEAANAMGSTVFQIITKILLPESLSGIINAMTITVVNLISYSAMAGTVGGGGLGDIAIRYGYQRFDSHMMLATIIIMIVLVQFIQWSGDKLSKKFT